jgi:hypothetical protein
METGTIDSTAVAHAAQSLAATLSGYITTHLFPGLDPQLAQTLSAGIAAALGTLAGGTGLPAAVEQALFDRARSREESQTTKAVQEAFDTFATRGFNTPRAWSTTSGWTIRIARPSRF